MVVALEVAMAAWKVVVVAVVLAAATAAEGLVASLVTAPGLGGWMEGAEGMVPTAVVTVVKTEEEKVAVPTVVVVKAVVGVAAMVGEVTVQRRPWRQAVRPSHCRPPPLALVKEPYCCLQ